MIPHVDPSCVAPCKLPKLVKKGKGIATPATPAGLIDLSLRQIRLIARTSKKEKFDRQ